MELRSFLDKLEASGANHSSPANITLEFTYRCNFSCPHCYIGDTSAERWPEELSGEAFCRIIDQLPALGVFVITCQGGEVFLHPEWKKILSHIRNLGLYIILKTNGSFFTRSNLEFLQSLQPMLRLEVSAYGASDEVCEEVTKNKISYKKFLDGINELKECGIPFLLNMLITKKNVHQADAIKNLAKSFDTQVYFDPLVIRNVRGESIALEERLSIEELLAFERKYSGEKVFFHGCRERSHYDCPMGKSSFVITPYGKINYCIDMNEPQLDVVRVSVAERWDEMKRHAEKIKSSVNRGCGSCSLFQGCMSCAADLWHENKSFESCSPFHRAWASEKEISS